jgi:Putative rRNA methylase
MLMVAMERSYTLTFAMQSCTTTGSWNVFLTRGAKLGRGCRTHCGPPHLDKRSPITPHGVVPGSSLSTACSAGKGSGVSLSNIRHSRIIARAIWDDAVRLGDVCIDATCGRGSDALYLARLAGKTGVVHALDIQEQAIDETRRRFAEARNDSDSIAELHAICRSHTDFTGLARVQECSVSAVTYNLGWYPGYGADKSVITTPETTIKSLAAVADSVRIGGVITVMGYIGHPGGSEEAEAVGEWAAALDTTSWSATYIAYPNRAQAPRLFVLERVGNIRQ